MRMVIVLLLAGCSSTPAPKGPIDQAPAGTPDQIATRAHMGEHFEIAARTATALVSADAYGARAALGELAELPGPDGWAHADHPAALELREAAKRGASAPSLDEIAIGFGEAMAACGSCHRSLGVGPRYGGLSAPPDEGDLRLHMYRHLWAVQRLWEGLVMPDSQVWASGVAVLSEDPPLSLIRRGGGSSDYAGDVHRLVAQTDLSKAERYGRILAACGGCHDEFNVPFSASMR